jgi:excisionase family DNA binding protein
MAVSLKGKDATASEGEKLAYSVPHAAAQIDVSPRTCWELIKRGELRTVRVRRRVLVTREALILYLRSGSDGGAKS